MSKYFLIKLFTDNMLKNGLRHVMRVLTGCQETRYTNHPSRYWLKDYNRLNLSSALNIIKMDIFGQ